MYSRLWFPKDINSLDGKGYHEKIVLGNAGLQKSNRFLNPQTNQNFESANVYYKSESARHSIQCFPVFKNGFPFFGLQSCRLESLETTKQ